MSKANKKSDIYDSDVLKNKATKKADLLNYLQNLHKDLSTLEQEIQQAPKGLHTTAAQLVQAKYLENTDRDIRILVTCCIVDVLRIYAPEAPYKDDDMIRVFEAIVKQIRSLQTTNAKSESGQRILYILNSIATVKSCLVPVLLDQKGVRTANEVVEEMFSAVTSIVDSNSTEEVFSSVCEVLQSCIEEYNNISPELLEILLVAILPAQKAENPMLYRVVATVLHTVSPIIMGTLTSIMSSILIGPGNQFQGKLSELADEVFALIYELHLISPALMQGILPSLTAQLRSEDDSTRSKVVQLLGKVYLTEGANYHEDFPQYFREFVGRMSDALATIRNEVIEYSCALMSKGIEIKFVLETLAHRLRDPDEDVRKKAVVRLFRQVFENLEMTDSLLLTSLFDRVKDKVIEIRKAAMVGISKLYWKYISSRLPALSDFEFTDMDSVKSQVPEDILEKLQIVPGILIKCWGYPDMETRHLTLQLMQEYLLPKQLHGGLSGNINQIRLTAMLMLQGQLREDEKPFFESILTFKAKVNASVGSLLEAKEGGRNSTGSSTSGHGGDQRTISRLKQILMKIAILLPTAENKKPGFFDRLLTTKDRAVWKLLEHITETSWTIEENSKFKEDLMKKMDSKSPLGEFVGMLYDVGSYQLVTAPMVEALLLAVLDTKFVANAQIPEVLSMLSKYCSKLFAGTSGMLRDWVDLTLVTEDDKGKKRQIKLEYFKYGIEVINNVASYLSEEEDVEKLGKALLEGMRNCSDDDSVGLLGSALRSIFATQESLSSRFLRDVVKFIKDIMSVHANGHRYVLLLKSAAALLEISPQLMEKKPSKILALQTVYAIFSNKTRRALVEHMKAEFASISNVSSSTVLMATAMIRVLSRLAILEDILEEVKTEEDFQFLLDFEHSVNFNELTQSLFECLETKGKSFQGFRPTYEKEESMLFRQAALCAMSMIATVGFSTLSTEHWHELGFAILHDDSEFQENLLSELNSIIKVQQVPLKYLAYPCLVANDSNLSQMAREGLTTAITRLRRIHEDVASKLVTATEDSERLLLQQQAAETMPENIMPFLLHILTYHPEFPTTVTATSAEDKARIKLVLSCIRMLVQSLQSKLKVPTSNLPFLFKQLNTINHRFVDRLDPNNVGLHFVTHLAVRLLQEQVKTADNLHVYPGEVFLPRELYEGIEAGKAQLQLGMITSGGRSDIPNMLDMTEFAIDQVMQVASKGRGKTGTTTNASPERKRPSKSNRPHSFEHKDVDMDEDQPRKRTKVVKELPQEQPTRSLPSRGAKATAKSYIEPEEMTDRDMEKIERNMEKKRKSSESGKSDSVRVSNMSPAKRTRISSTSFGGEVNAGSSFLSSPFSSTTTGRPSLRAAATEAVASVHEMRNRKAENLQTDDSDDFDLFVSQSVKKARDSGTSKGFTKSASTDNEKTSSSSSQNEKDDSDSLLASRESRRSNRVLTERPSNVRNSSRNTEKAKPAAKTPTSGSEEESAVPVDGQNRTRRSGRSAAAVENIQPTVASKRTRQMRA